MLHRLLSFIAHAMTMLRDRVLRVLTALNTDKNQALADLAAARSELAETKQALVEALAAPQASQEEIEAARAEAAASAEVAAAAITRAETAEAAVIPLQALAADDTAEDALINADLDVFDPLMPVAEPPAEVADEAAEPAA